MKCKLSHNFSEINLNLMFSDDFNSFPHPLEIEANFISVQNFQTNVLLVISMYLDETTFQEH